MDVFEFAGMGVSSFAIIFMKLKLEWHSIIFTSLGGITGIIFGEQFNLTIFSRKFGIAKKNSGGNIWRKYFARKHRLRIYK
jgi:hypothetical protein